MSVCPKCRSRLSRVTDSRPSKMGVRRRRVCHKCLTRWTSVEMPISVLETLTETIQLSVQMRDSLMALTRRMRLLDNEEESE